MVYEARAGQVIVLGASSWRIEEITRDRVLVSPAPGVGVKRTVPLQARILAGTVNRCQATLRRPGR